MQPGRLLLAIDATRGTFASTAVFTATLNGAPLPVQLSWSCRTTREEMCFQGFFIDLSAAGVAPDVNYTLALTVPPFSGGSSATGPRIGYDMRNGDLPGMPVTLNSSDCECFAVSGAYRIIVISSPCISCMRLVIVADWPPRTRRDARSPHHSPLSPSPLPALALTPLLLKSAPDNLCWAMCNATGPACVAWAYGDFKAGCETAPHCWLKQAIGPWDADDCRVAGVQISQPSPFQGVFYDNVDTVYAAVE